MHAILSISPEIAFVQEVTVCVRMYMHVCVYICPQAIKNHSHEMKPE